MQNKKKVIQPCPDKEEVFTCGQILVRLKTAISPRSSSLETFRQEGRENGP